MNLSICVLGAPFTSQASYSAYQFAKAVLRSEHRIFRIFFYQDAVHSATTLAAPPQDEFDLYSAWHDLAKAHSINCVVCIAAAARRGIINAAESQRHSKSGNNLAPCFTLGGLGQLIEAHIESDRLITFGA